jgi:hypothetical protein
MRATWLLVILAGCTRSPDRPTVSVDAAPRAAAPGADAMEVCADDKMTKELAERARDAEVKKLADAERAGAADAVRAAVADALDRETLAAPAAPARGPYGEALARWQAVRGPGEPVDANALDDAIELARACANLAAAQTIESCGQACLGRTVLVRWLGQKMIATRTCALDAAEAAARLYGKPRDPQRLVSICQAAIARDLKRCAPLADAREQVLCRALAGGGDRECDALPEAKRGACRADVALVAAASGGVVPPGSLDAELGVLIDAANGKADVRACKAAALDWFSRAKLATGATAQR